MKEIDVPGAVDDFVRYIDLPGRPRSPQVREKAVLTLLPPKWLPDQPKKILLLVESPDCGSDTAVGEPTVFARWRKYYDAYSLTLTRAGVVAEGGEPCLSP